MPIGTSDGQSYKNEWEYQLASATNIPRALTPANDNKNLQIDTDPYTQGVIDNQWNSMVKRGNQPHLQIVPPTDPSKRSSYDGSFQMAAGPVHRNVEDNDLPDNWTEVYQVKPGVPPELQVPDGHEGYIPKKKIGGHDYMWIAPMKPPKLEDLVS